jgi:hypothetical protein
MGWIGALGLLLAAGCSGGSDGGTTLTGPVYQASRAFALAGGDSWQFRYAHSSAPGESVTQQVTVTADVSFNDTLCYRVREEMTLDGGDRTKDYFFTVTVTGVLQHGVVEATNGEVTNNTIYEPAHLFLPTGFQVGQAWSYGDNGARYRRTVEGVETVSVPAGTYDEAVKVSEVDTTIPEETETYWFVEDVGVVKIIETDLDPDTGVVYTSVRERL